MVIWSLCNKKFLCRLISFWHLSWCLSSLFFPFFEQISLWLFCLVWILWFLKIVNSLLNIAYGAVSLGDNLGFQHQTFIIRLLLLLFSIIYYYYCLKLFCYFDRWGISYISFLFWLLTIFLKKCWAVVSICTSYVVIVEDRSNSLFFVCVFSHLAMFPLHICYSFHL